MRPVVDRWRRHFHHVGFFLCVRRPKPTHEQNRKTARDALRRVTPSYEAHVSLSPVFPQNQCNNIIFHGIGRSLA
jgi:hypothetical protein